VHSPLEDLAGGEFKKILLDDEIPLTDCRRLLLCTGKVYYDLIDEREERKIDDVAIMRVEQLYPLSEEELLERLTGLARGSELVWVQDEPTNMGAWPYIKLNFGDTLAARFKLRRVSRVESASPSTGSMAAHKLEQGELIEAAFGDL
jgi:2-oxoglutarate dehydrogenase E1 component